MKEQKDIDWELFEMLEGELSPEQEAALLDKINNDTNVSSDWDFMQMTELDAPEVIYPGKQNLIKKDTTLIAFSAVQWRRVIGIAAVLALCYPLWQLLMPKTENIDGLAGSATEIVNRSSEVESPVIINNLVPTIDDTDAIEHTPVRQIKHKAIAQHTIKTIDPEVKESLPEQSSPALVRIKPSHAFVSLTQYKNDPEPLPKATAQYNMAALLPADKGMTYNGIRPALNSGLAALTSPFRNAKIKVQPTDKNTLQIIYSSLQYNATAMVSLKPLK